MKIAAKLQSFQWGPNRTIWPGCPTWDRRPYSTKS